VQYSSLLKYIFLLYLYYYIYVTIALLLCYGRRAPYQVFRYDTVSNQSKQFIVYLHKTEI